MLKFFSDQGGAQSAHGGQLTWPGTADGFPVRGAVPDLMQDEYDNIPLALDYKSGLFKLFDPAEKQAFDNIMDRIVNGWFMQHRRIDRWSDQHCGMVVWLEWVQIYGETPGAKHPGASHGKTTLEMQPGTGPQGIAPPS